MNLLGLLLGSAWASGINLYMTIAGLGMAVILVVVFIILSFWVIKKMFHFLKPIFGFRPKKVS